MTGTENGNCNAPLPDSALLDYVLVMQAQEGTDCKVYSPIGMSFTSFLNAAEWGFRQHEKGNNLESMRIHAHELWNA